MIEFVRHSWLSLEASSLDLPLFTQVSRRLQHRLLLIYHFPSLLSLDGVRVSAEEREAANVSFSRQQVRTIILQSAQKTGRGKAE